VCCQTITGAMSTINPPVELAEPDNQFRLEYIQETASQLSFDYPPVKYTRIYFSGVTYSDAISLVSVRLVTAICTLELSME